MQLSFSNLLQKSIIRIASLLVILTSFGFSSTGYASSLTALSDTMSRVQASASSSHVLKFTTPSGATTSGKTITLTFPNTFNFTSKTIASLTFTHGPSTGLETVETLAAVPAANVWGAVFSGTNNSVLTLTSPTVGAALAANDKVIFTYNSTNSINPASTGTYLIVIGGSFGDTGEIGVNLVSSDQIAITATVDPSLTFTVNTAALALGSLSSASVTSSTNTSNLTIATNALSGYTISVSDAGNGTTAGLNNAAASYLIPTSTTTLAAGTEGYGGACNKVSGSGSCSFATAANAVNTFSLTPATFASFASKPAGTDTYSVIVRAAISTTTTAGSYADTLTLIGSGNF